MIRFFEVEQFIKCHMYAGQHQIVGILEFEFCLGPFCHKGPTKVME